MSKQFSIPFEGTAEAAVAKIKASAEKNHVHLSGDHVAGEFNVKGIEGRYQVEGNLLKLTVEKKPILIPWALIESKMKEFL